MTAKTFLTAAWLAVLAPAALAHSFDTVVIAPDDITASQRADMATAFLVASEETDAHANQESDGHLGGLDVYLTLLDATEIGAIASGRPQFVAVPVALGDMGAITATIAQSSAVMVPPMAADASDAAQYLARAANPSLAPFATRFAEQTGRQPGPAAIATYIAARRIDGAVRSAGDASDPDRLKALIAR